MSPQQQATRVAEVFSRIHREQMAGIPILNERLQVECLGFQEYQGRTVGILITPWLMNLIMLPAAGEAWSQLKLGSKQEHRFPANTFRFLVNEVEGLGSYQAHSLYSPMHEFHSQEHARAAAQSFMETLMVEVEEPESDPHDEELLGRILRGEEAPEIPPEAEVELAAVEASAESAAFSRRDLLRGAFLNPKPGA
jgi:[NiFe] hydrogenase assembly HybE family chaperone